MRLIVGKTNKSKWQLNAATNYKSITILIVLVVSNFVFCQSVADDDFTNDDTTTSSRSTGFVKSDNPNLREVKYKPIGWDFLSKNLDHVKSKPAPEGKTSNNQLKIEPKSSSNEQLSVFGPVENPNAQISNPNGDESSQLTDHNRPSLFDSIKDIKSNRNLINDLLRAHNEEKVATETASSISEAEEKPISQFDNQQQVFNGPEERSPVDSKDLNGRDSHEKITNDLQPKERNVEIVREPVERELTPEVKENLYAQDKKADEALPPFKPVDEISYGPIEKPVDVKSNDQLAIVPVSTSSVERDSRPQVSLLESFGKLSKPNLLAGSQNVRSKLNDLFSSNTEQNNLQAWMNANNNAVDDHQSIVEVTNNVPSEKRTLALDQIFNNNIPEKDGPAIVTWPKFIPSRQKQTYIPVIMIPVEMFPKIVPNMAYGQKVDDINGAFYKGITSFPTILPPVRYFPPNFIPQVDEAMKNPNRATFVKINDSPVDQQSQSTEKISEFVRDEAINNARNVDENQGQIETSDKDLIIDSPKMSDSRQSENIHDVINDLTSEHNFYDDSNFEDLIKKSKVSEPMRKETSIAGDFDTNTKSNGIYESAKDLLSEAPSSIDNIFLDRQPAKVAYLPTDKKVLSSPDRVESDVHRPEAKQSSMTTDTKPTSSVLERKIDADHNKNYVLDYLNERSPSQSSKLDLDFDNFPPMKIENKLATVGIEDIKSNNPVVSKPETANQGEGVKPVVETRTLSNPIRSESPKVESLKEPTYGPATFAEHLSKNDDDLPSFDGEQPDWPLVKPTARKDTTKKKRAIRKLLK